MRHLQNGPMFREKLKWFRDAYGEDDQIVSIEENTIRERHWMYAIKVVVKPGAKIKLPRLFNGYTVDVEEQRTI